MVTPSQKRASSASVRKHCPGELLFVPPRIPTHDVETAPTPLIETGTPVPHDGNASLAGSARIDQHRLDPLLGSTREIADDGQIDVPAVRTVPVQRHRDRAAPNRVRGSQLVHATPSD